MKPTQFSIFNFQLSIFSALAVAVLLGACASKTPTPTSFVVEGILPDSSCHGEQIYLQRQSDGKVLGVTKIEGDRFTFTGVADTAEYCRIDVSQSLYNNFILENGHICVRMEHAQIWEKQPLPTGTKGNDERARIEAIEKELRDDYIQLIDSLRSLYPDEKELEEAATPHFEAYKQRMAEKGKELFALHRDDAIGLTLFQSRFYKYISLEDKSAIIESLAPHLRNTHFVEKELGKVNREKTRLQQEQKTGKGVLYTDIKGTDVNGKPLALSDYVDKGNYVLVDFWASWCGPCRGEIPNLRKVYETYNGKGLTVLGIFVSDNIKNMKTAVKEEQITWPQLFDSERTATQTYGVNGIPHIILFGPDGTILERDQNKLRGENMIKTVGEYLEAEQQ